MCTYQLLLYNNQLLYIYVYTNIFIYINNICIIHIQYTETCLKHIDHCISYPEVQIDTLNLDINKSGSNNHVDTTIGEISESDGNKQPSFI